MPMNSVTVLPAYARQYETFDDIMAHWNAGKDFKLANGPYFSRHDLSALQTRGITHMIFMWIPLRGGVQQMTLPIDDPKVVA